MLALHALCGLAKFLAVPDGLPTELGASIARGSAHRKEIEIRTHFERPARVPMWIAGISICLLATSGVVAIVRSIPASYASVPEEGAPSRHGTAPSGFEDTHAKVAQARFAVARATASGSTIAANAIAGRAYEITIRFRDGSTTVFNEATPRTWPSGSRVIVIGALNASNN